MRLLRRLRPRVVAQLRNEAFAERERAKEWKEELGARKKEKVEAIQVKTVSEICCSTYTPWQVWGLMVFVAPSFERDCHYSYSTSTEFQLSY